MADKMELVLLLLLAASAARCEHWSNATSRDGRLFNLFVPVRFNNAPCTGTDSTERGVCLTRAECDAESNSRSVGNCAAGFGVCCQIAFIGNADLTVTRNCSFIQNEGFPATTSVAGTNTFTLTRPDNDVCFIRLDFDASSVASPTLAADNGNCEVDMISFSQAGGTPLPVICGNNDGMHIYLSAGGPASSGTLSITHTFTGTANMRRFRYKVSHIPCGTSFTPDAGCVQYFTGPTGFFQNYNFNGGYHLNNQFFPICFRQEEGRCTIQYMTSTTDENPFKVVGTIANNKGLAGNDCETDFIFVPQARDLRFFPELTMCSSNGASPISIATTNFITNNVERFCGGSLTCERQAERAPGTIISTAGPPFNIFVNFNAMDARLPGNLNRGFRLNYLQRPCGDI